MKPCGWRRSLGGPRAENTLGRSLVGVERPLDADLGSFSNDGDPEKSLEDHNHSILANDENPSWKGLACLAPAHRGAVSVLSTQELVCDGTNF